MILSCDGEGVFVQVFCMCFALVRYLSRKARATQSFQTEQVDERQIATRNTAHARGVGMPPSGCPALTPEIVPTDPAALSPTAPWQPAHAPPRLNSSHFFMYVRHYSPTTTSSTCVR